MTPTATAQAFLSRHSALLGLNSAPTDLHPREVRRSPGGLHVVFEQMRGEIPVLSTSVTVHLSPNGEPLFLTGTYHPDLPGAEQYARAPGVGRAEALELALAHAGGAEVLRGKLDSQLGILPVTGYPLVWRVVAPTAVPFADLRLDVDAETGILHQRRNVLFHAVPAAGQVFWPNPRKTSGNPSLWSEVRSRGYQVTEGQTVPVSFPVSMGAEGQLQLDTAQVQMVDFYRPHLPPPRRPDANFVYAPGQVSFEDTMAYFWVQAALKYIEDLGFTDVPKRPVRVDAQDNIGKGAYYSPLLHQVGLAPSTQERPGDAQDATVILHELGHAVQLEQIPDFGETEEALALAEGWADALAALLFAPLLPTPLAVEVADWAVQPQGTRRVDLPLRYPADLTGRRHKDGQIWSGTLWSLYQELGGDATSPAARLRARDLTLQLALESHHYLNPRSGFADAGAALLWAGRVLHQGRLEPAILSALQAHTIPWQTESLIRM